MPARGTASGRAISVERALAIARATASGRLNVDGSGGGGVALTSGLAVRTAGDLTTTNVAPSWVDLTGMSVTITTGAHRCLITVVASAKHSASDTICLNLDIDGVSQGQALGCCFADSLSSQNRNLSFSWLTAALTAASHTFKLQFATGSAGTMTVYASAGTEALVFGVMEIDSP